MLCYCGTFLCIVGPSNRFGVYRVSKQPKMATKQAENNPNWSPECLEKCILAHLSPPFGPIMALDFNTAQVGPKT